MTFFRCIRKGLLHMSIEKIAADVLHHFLNEKDLQKLKQCLSTNPQALVREIEKKEVEKNERMKAQIRCAVAEIQEEHLEVAIKKHGEKEIQEKGILHFVDMRDILFEFADFTPFAIQQVLIRLLHSGIPFAKELVIEILKEMKNRTSKERWDEIQKHNEIKDLL